VRIEVPTAIEKAKYIRFLFEREMNPHEQTFFKSEWRQHHLARNSNEQQHHRQTAALVVALQSNVLPSSGLQKFFHP
jgi:hypothetical protein